MILATITTGFAVLLTQIAYTEWRRWKAAITADVNHSFGHAHRVYPTAKPHAVKPGKYLTNTRQ
jgi:hypothetical protein